MDAKLKYNKEAAVVIYPTNLDDADCEIAVFGFLLIDQAKREDFALFKSHYFVTEQGQKLFALFTRVYDNNEPFDVVHLSDSEETKMVLYDAIRYPYTQLMTLDAGLLKLNQLHVARLAYSQNMTIQELLENDSHVSEELFAQIEGAIEDFREQTKNNNAIKPVSELINNFFDEKNALYAQGGKAYMLPLPVLSEYSMTEGHLCSVVARTKSGKTTLLCQIALDAINKSRPVLFISLEVKASDIRDKIIALNANINPFIVQNYGRRDININDNQMKQVSDSLINLAEKPLSFMEGFSVSVKSIKRAIRDFMQANPTGIVIIDQLQFIQADKPFISRVYEYDYIMSELKAYCLEYKTIMFLAHQLNRDIEKRGDSFPQTSDIKDCGRIEEISDLVIMFAKAIEDKKDERRFCSIISRHWAGKKLIMDWNTKLAKFV